MRFLLIALLLGFSSAYANDSNTTSESTASSPASSPITSFTPSDFQNNGPAIIDLELDAKNYLQEKEIDDINFGLHLINYGNKIQNPQEQFLWDYSRTFCNPDYESNIPECNKNNTKDMIYANLRPSSIFDIQYDKVERQLAKSIVRTLIEPFPDNQLNSILSDPQAVQNSDKQKSMANLIAPQAALMLARNSLNEMIAKRNGNENSKSIMQMIHDESTRRLTDPAWIKNIIKLPADQLLMELLQIEAFKLWVDYSKFAQNERIEALLATLLSNQVLSGKQISGVLEQANSPETQKAISDAKKNIPTMPALIDN